MLAGVSMIGCFLVAQRVAVHPEEVLWSPDALGRIAAVYLLLTLPFLFIGCAVGLALMRHRPEPVYAGDLVGAGVGAIAVVALLYIIFPTTVLRAVACLTFVAALLSLGTQVAGRRVRWLSAVLIVAAWSLPSQWLALDLSEYKGLSQMLRVEGTFVAHQRSSPLGLITAVESPIVPLRHAPGLSLAARQEPPPQVALFVDAGGMSVITDTSGGEESLTHLDLTTAALPYHVASPASVLVLGAGGGEQVLRARLHGAEEVVAVELDRRVVELLLREYGELSGHLYEQPGVEVVIAEARGFVERGGRRFELIENTVVGGFGGQAPGLHALTESYLYTVEAIDGYLERLAPEGLLSITGWVRTPARGTVRLAATVLEAMRRRGVPSPERRLIVIRGWQTATILVKNGEFGVDEITRMRDFCRQRMFDVVFFSGMARVEANRHNRLAEPELHDALVALTGPEADRFLASSKFELTPATDDRPFFHQTFRWRSLIEIMALKGRGGLPLLEAGYLVLVVTLAQSILASLAVVALPAWLVVWRSGSRRSGLHPSRVVLYFAGLGVGFLFLEVAFLQRLILVLHHPVLAAALVLTGFLVFAGLGSAAAGRWSRSGLRLEIRWVLLVVAVLAVLTLFVARLGGAWLAGASVGVRIPVALALIAPLAFTLGMPFPLGLAALREATDPAGRAPGFLDSDPGGGGDLSGGDAGRPGGVEESRAVVVVRIVLFEVAGHRQPESDEQWDQRRQLTPTGAACRLC
jgi:hypothetical protein